MWRIGSILGYISTYPPHIEEPFNADFALIAFFFAAIFGFWSAYVTTYNAIGETEKKKV